MVAIASLGTKNICILGFGREGRSTLSVLRRFAPKATITIADHLPQPDLDPAYPRITGEDYLSRLEKFDVIIKSPGIPWEPPANLALKVTSATQLFLDSIPAGALTIGITGTKGKSSTANLIFHILAAGGKPVFLAGNIGRPMLDLLPAAKPEDIFVLELSSYQLNDLTTSPILAVVTSFFPDHIDYHQNLENYLEAKTHIARFQPPSGKIFYNETSPACAKIAALSPGEKIGFSPAALPPHLITELPSGTAASNVAAAYLVAKHLGVSEATIAQSLKSVRNLPHRQETLGMYGGIVWIDDSAATTPQSTQIALTTQAGEISTLIVGGLNRGYDFKDLASQIVTDTIDNLICFPETGPLIKQLIEVVNPANSINFFETTSMSEAVEFASKHTKSGKICLLSSGAPSYNLYRNFNERGDAFKKAVAALSKLL